MLPTLCLAAVLAGPMKDTQAHTTLQEKTLIVWASPANLNQRSGSALTIDDGAGGFDAIVLGELEPKKWMAGSNFYHRTHSDQSGTDVETAERNKFVQMAVVYHGGEVDIYRNGKPYDHYSFKDALPVYDNSACVLFGKRHLAANDPLNSFEGSIRDARIYDRALTGSEVASLTPGSLGSIGKPWAWWDFANQGLREETGRFGLISITGDVHLAEGCLVLGGKGATVANYPTPSGATVSVPKEWNKDGNVPEDVVKSARLLREKFLADPYRPGYHFCIPEDDGNPGDPNGAFYANGRYHLMYLYNRAGSGFCWGHISSADLIHWRHHPDAIGPGDGDDGCFSGGAFLDTDGTAYLTYWMLWGAKGIGLAKSLDPNFDHWKKSSANPIIQSTEFGVTEIKDANGKTQFLGSADPSNIWKKGDTYYVLTGSLAVLNKVGRQPDSPLSEQGDRLYLFESKDLRTWKYDHVFYQRRPEWTDRSEDDMCPSFLPLPSRPDGGPASKKHLLLFISHNKGCQYYVGSYRDDQFFPEHHGRMTWVDNTFFAPEALIDGKGRQIMWSWLLDNPSGEKAKGWSGVYGLPRTLWLGDDGTLRIRPVSELETLRGKGIEWLAPTVNTALQGFDGDSFELQLNAVPGKERVGLMVRTSPDGSERTEIYYQPSSHELVMDTTHSGGDGRRTMERAPLELKGGEHLHLRVYVDKSVVEVFANDRQAITRRVYPTRHDSLGVKLIGTVGTEFEHVKAWTMNPSNPY